MDPEEKKRISNEKRLLAIKNWKKKGSVQSNTLNKRVVFSEISGPEVQSKPQLFGSDDEDNFENDFRVRPQFESAKYGKKLLEMNSELSERFKLDERFIEDEPESELIEDEDDERNKNIKLLEQVLGHEVPLRELNASLKKKQIRFDPESEDASMYIKTADTTETTRKKGGEPKKKKSKREVREKAPEPELPKSEERYVEVTSDLKDILQSSTTFSLSQKFNIDENKSSVFETFKKISWNVQGDNNKNRVEPKSSSSQNSKYFAPKLKMPFFMVKDDVRLKEGIEFFLNKKSSSEIRDEWNDKRKYVIKLFKRKKKAGIRKPVTRVKTAQMKRALRSKLKD